MNNNFKGGLFNGRGRPQPLELRAKAKRQDPPLEKKVQGAFLDWVATFEPQNQILKAVFPIPNGMWAMNKNAARAQRMRKGIPDVLCSAPSSDGRFHGLYIEFKRESGGKVSDEQAFYLKFFADLGYRTAICRTWWDAAKLVNDHLGLKLPVQPSA